MDLRFVQLKEVVVGGGGQEGRTILMKANQLGMGGQGRGGREEEVWRWLDAAFEGVVGVGELDMSDWWGLRG